MSTCFNKSVDDELAGIADILEDRIRIQNDLDKLEKNGLKFNKRQEQSTALRTEQSHAQIQNGE